MQMEAVGGTAYLKVNGEQYALAGSFKGNWGGVEREPKTGYSGLVGYSEKPVPASIEAELYTVATLDFDQLNGFKNETVTFELVNGRSYVLRNAFQYGAIEPDFGEGTTTVRFAGPKLERVG